MLNLKSRNPFNLTPTRISQIRHKLNFIVLTHNFSKIIIWTPNYKFMTKGVRQQISIETSKLLLHVKTSNFLSGPCLKSISDLLQNDN